MYVLGDSCIQDKEFQFCLTICIKHKIGKLVEAISNLERGVLYLENLKEEGRYTKNVTYRVRGAYLDNPIEYNALTLSECKALLGKYLDQYILLVEICEKAQVEEDSYVRFNGQKDQQSCKQHLVENTLE